MKTSFGLYFLSLSAENLLAILQDADHGENKHIVDHDSRQHAEALLLHPGNGVHKRHD